MKLRHLLYIVPLIAACTNESPYSGPIGLRAGFENSYDSKAAATAVPYTDSVPSRENPLKADLWFSTTESIFKGTEGVSTQGDKIDVHTKITYYGSTITIPDPYTEVPEVKYLHYPPYHGTVYCVGLYPQDKWTASSDGTYATATIDGTQDLMYANQKSGSDKSALSTERQLYNHELTWLKVRFYGRDHATAETWGKIKKITVKSKPTAKVTFSSDSVEYIGDDVKLVAFDDPSGTEIQTTIYEYGSIFVSPTTENKFYVDIECENHSRTDVEVPLTNNDGEAFDGNTKGLLFVIILYFQTLPTIDFSASLSGWEDEGRSLELEAK